MKGNVVDLDAKRARLKRRLRAHLKSLGFTRDALGGLVPPSMTKESYREVHLHQRNQKLKDSREWIDSKSASLIEHFASGRDVSVSDIRPRLEVAAGGTRAGDLFRFASYNWRIPVSEGYGRRLRFLVWDESNNKLIGLIALGDAVFNLKARDANIGWDHLRRKEALVHLMDAYVLGAVPPYNALLGGKLLASLVRTTDVVEAFDEKYRDSTGLISKEKKKARLVAVTTSSSLGRSSVYNRVSLCGRRIFEPIGYTSGWGHFHFSDALFDDLRSYIADCNDEYANGFDFGQGPNWRIRVVKRALALLGLSPDLVKHGMVREVFFCAVAQNAREYLRGDHVRVRYGDLRSVAEVGKAAIDRWMLPRSLRMPEFQIWQQKDFLTSITTIIRSSSNETRKVGNGLGG